MFEALNQQVQESGFAITAPLVDKTGVAALLSALQPQAATLTDARGGLRLPLRSHPTVRGVATAGVLQQAAETVLGVEARAVRCLLFDKTPGANWKVVWHQDLTIAVAATLPTPGFTAWTVKAGIPHVQPPVGVLDNMIAVRLHLDECGTENGPVRVLPGSHRSGRLSADEIAIWRTRVSEVICTVARGGLLIMRPLLLHASSPALAPAHRRVLHVEYAGQALPGGLLWHEAAAAEIDAAAV
jgi:ectoine hydroxylase-related dioxygenase (phytanoyl-CoA dioxygenase family)